MMNKTYDAGDVIESVMQNDYKGLITCLASGISPNCYEDGDKLSPLHFAVSYESFTCAQILIAFGADLSAEDGDGDTPIMLAQQLDNEQMLELFTNPKKFLH